MLRIACAVLLTVTLAGEVEAQKPVPALGTVDENFTFTAAGFTPTPLANQLDSDEFAGTGMSDGSFAFGGTVTSGDWARGGSSGGVTIGGLYAWNGGPDSWLFVQPTDTDFTPGSLRVRYVNSTGSTLTAIEVDYDIWILNDQERASSWTLSLTHGATTVEVPAASYTSPAAADLNGWFPVHRAVVVTGFTIPLGDLFTLNFHSDDAGGVGSRDEIGMDKLRVRAGMFADGFESKDMSAW